MRVHSPRPRYGGYVPILTTDAYEWTTEAPLRLHGREPVRVADMWQDSTPPQRPRVQRLQVSAADRATVGQNREHGVARTEEERIRAARIEAAIGYHIALRQAVLARLPFAEVAHDGTLRTTVVRVDPAKGRFVVSGNHHQGLAVRMDDTDFLHPDIAGSQAAEMVLSMFTAEETTHEPTQTPPHP